MASDLKQEYLDLKYSFIDGDSDPKPKKKAKKKTPKKANHKHEYQNIIIEYIYDKNYPVRRLAGKSAFALESYCPICGKLSSPVNDKKAKKLFPHIYPGHFGFISHIRGYEQEYEDYKQYCLTYYPHYSMPDYWESAWRGQTFLDLDKIIPAKV